MEAYGGVEVYIHILLTSAPAVGEWSASLPGLFNPGERAPQPLDRRLDGHQSRSGRSGENSWPYWDSNFDSSVASRYTDYLKEELKSIFNKCIAVNLRFKGFRI
jgi:hypothetical protein